MVDTTNVNNATSSTTMAEPAVDAIFADAENDPELSYKPLAPSLDLDALRREAEAEHAQNIVPMAFTSPHVPSGSSSMPAANNINVRGKSKDQEDDDERKPRRKVPKLDEARLIGPDGFPQLIKDTKNFKPKGNGHEASDLNRLLQIYLFWTHKLFPKTQFRDTIERVEKLCHSRRMHVALSVWRDEAHGIVAGAKPQDVEDIADPTSDDDVENSGDDANTDSHITSHSLPSSGAISPPSSPRVPSRPPSSASDLEHTSLDDDIDLETFIREEEERAAALTVQTSVPKARYAARKGNEREEGLLDEDEAMGEEPAGSTDLRPSPLSAENLFDDDVDMGSADRDSKDVGQPPSSDTSHSAPAVAATPDDDWDDMYL